MTQKEISLHYLKLLESGAMEQLLTLFSQDATIHSPVYGVMPASSFYRDLMNDTTNSKLKLLGIFEENNNHKLAIYFNYIWTLKNNEIVNFNVVDILEFDHQNKIKKLNIIYDATVAKDKVKQLEE